jgi:hypothetical protein
MVGPLRLEKRGSPHTRRPIPRRRRPHSSRLKTRSPKNAEAKGFFFWRGLESGGGGKKLTFFDGERWQAGLELNMTERGEGDGLKLSVTRKK